MKFYKALTTGSKKLWDYLLEKKGWVFLGVADYRFHQKNSLDRTVIIATHNRDLVECGDRLITIEDRRITGNRVLRGGREEGAEPTLKNENRDVGYSPVRI